MNKTINKAQKFINQVRKSGVLISNATIYGSWAKGTASDDSDIDVCVVSPRFGKDYIKEMVELRKIALEVDSRIEPIPFTPQDFNDPVSTLASEIRQHSIPLQ